MARTYTNFLLMENVFKNAPALEAGVNDYIVNLYQKIFSIKVPVVVAACHNTCGKVVSLGDAFSHHRTPTEPEIVAGLDIPANLSLFYVDETQYNALKALGITSVGTRTIGSCTAVDESGKRGLCSMCLSAEAAGYSSTIGDVNTIASYIELYTWFGETYSGSLLGLKAIPRRALPVREALYQNAFTSQELTAAFRQLSKIDSVPLNIVDYCEGLENKLEKALLIIAAYVVFTAIKS